MSNHTLAMLGMLTAETMLFVGLIGTYVLFRLSAASWPPADQPRYPVFITALNTVVLFASLLPMVQARRAMTRHDASGAASALDRATALGSLFVLVQGIEWFRLVRHGLTLSTSAYGSVFYVVIGCHALHVLSAIVWLTIVGWMVRSGRTTPEAPAALEMSSLYWYFVVGLWAILFPLVYLY